MTAGIKAATQSRLALRLVEGFAQQPGMGSLRTPHRVRDDNVPAHETLLPFRKLPQARAKHRNTRASDFQAHADPARRPGVHHRGDLGHRILDDRINRLFLLEFSPCWHSERIAGGESLV
jgi:hypothetical protein